MPAMWYIFVCIFLGFSHGHEGNDQKIEVPIELAIVATNNKLMTLYEKRQVWTLARGLPDYFVINENHTRVAVVTYSDNGTAVVLSNFTSDESEIRNLKTPKIQGNSLLDSMRVIQNRIFPQSRPDVQKVVILIALGYGTPDYRVSQEVDQSARSLRNSGALVYVMLFNTKRDLAVSQNITADRSQIFHISKFNYLVDDIYQKLACKFEETCRFDESQQCVADWWRPNAGLKPCRNPEPDSATKQCQIIDCEEICDRFWPWGRDNCDIDQSCAGEMSKIIRIQPKPQLQEKYSKLIQNCPVEKPFVCSGTCPERRQTTSTTSVPSSESHGLTTTDITEPVITDTMVNFTVSNATEIFYAEVIDTATTNRFPVWAFVVIGLCILVSLAVIGLLVYLGLRRKRVGKYNGIMSSKTMVSLENFVQQQELEENGTL